MYSLMTFALWFYKTESHKEYKKPSRTRSGSTEHKYNIVLFLADIRKISKKKKKKKTHEKRTEEEEKKEEKDRKDVERRHEIGFHPLFLFIEL